MVIDLFGLTAEEVRARFPAVYQWVYERVKPERDQNNRASYRNNWWIHGEPRAALRPALAGLSRYIATPVTAKHRFFLFLDGNILPDDAIIAIATWMTLSFLVCSPAASMWLGRWLPVVELGVGNDPRYLKTRCFEPFPFPAATDAQQARIRALAEQLDAHRKRQQAQHPKLTLTDMYNVLEKLRAGEPLTAKDKAVHEQGLVSVLREIHDELDAAVCDAYGWPVTLTDEEILARLVALNAERAAEEAQGLVRWLRPAYQAPSDHAFTFHAARPDPGRLPRLRSLPRNTPPPSLAQPHGRTGPGRPRRARCAGRTGVRRSSRRSVHRRARRTASPSCWRRWSRWGRREGRGWIHRRGNQGAFSCTADEIPTCLLLMQLGNWTK